MILKRNFLPICVFFTAVFAALVYNLVLREKNTTLIFDSAHYFRSAFLLESALKSFAKPGETKELASYLLVDGPVLPVLGAVALWVFSFFESWKAFVIIQSGLHAVSSLLVFLLTKKLSKSSSWALIAGLCFALNTAGIIACGRFLTETLTATLLLLVTYFLVRSSSASADDSESKLKIFSGTFWAGVFEGILVLTKAALLPSILIANLLVFLGLKNKSKKGQWLVVILLASALPLVSWLFASKALCGQYSIFPQRSASLNIAAGTDLETDGWSAVPLPPLFELNYNEKPAYIFYGLYHNHPLEFVSLMTRKILRLFCFPWNDFRQIVLGIDLSAQIYLHQALLLLTLCSIWHFIGRAFSKTFRTESLSGSLIAYLSLLFIFGHLIFLPFETIVRYAYPAMAFMFVLAGAFCASLAERRISLERIVALAIAALLVITSWNFDTKPYLLCLGLSVNQAFVFFWLLRLLAFLLFVAIYMLSVVTLSKEKTEKNNQCTMAQAFACAAIVVTVMQCFYAPNNTEWSCSLFEKNCAERFFTLPETSTKQIVWAAVLIDSDEKADELEFLVNDLSLSDQVNSLWSIPNAYRYHPTVVHIIKTEADAENVPLSRMRQWRLVQVPLELVKSGMNSIKVRSRNGHPVTLYGDYLDPKEKRIHLPSLHGFSVARCQNDEQYNDGRVNQPISFALNKSNCKLFSPQSQFDSKDLSPAPGIQAGNYRLFLMLAHKPGSLAKPDDYEIQALPEFSNCFITLH